MIEDHEQIQIADVRNRPVVTSPRSTSAPSHADEARPIEPGDLMSSGHVGVKDNGPIPEGEYRFLATAMTTFNTAARSGFFLHGGLMPGSSGCIDIGDGAFSSFVRHLLGYTAAIVVTVRYSQPAPDVGALARAAGRFMYPGRGKIKDPSIWDRFGSMFGGDED